MSNETSMEYPVKIIKRLRGSHSTRPIRSYKSNMTLPEVLLYIFMILLVGFTALPLVYMISTAFKPLDELFIFPPRYLVRKPTIQNFHDLVISLGSSTVPFARYIFNSLYVTVITVTCTVIVSSLGAYGLVKHKPRGSKAIFNFIIAALMFSPHVTQIPRYMVVNSLGLIDSYWALIIPNIAVAYNFFLMKQFTEQFPNELLDSSRVDGANEWIVFWKIVMPSLTPAWSTLVVFSFVSNWNDYFSPLIYITSRAKKTLPPALQTIGAGGSIARAGAVAAATLLMTLPTVIIFTFMQSKVMETMTYSGIKG
ncbi:MAG TPA: carbohydrate ABC transporter permease [Clostridiales bacterium]|nr:carbohydrate ABC transporter permease [Clostridiales bacterium]